MNDGESTEAPHKSAILGCLIGTAVGDALGLPYEGLSPRRAARLLGIPDRHRMLWGRGMFSDDTEHACLTLQSLMQAGNDTGRFQQDLCSRLRWWLLSLPAGTGLATARAICKLWLGFSPSSSGVFSAGNGPAMRSPILGVMLPLNSIRPFVTASTEITHTDPKANWGAIAVALAAHLASHSIVVDPREYLSLLSFQLCSERASEFLELVRHAVDGISRFSSAEEYSASITSRRGISGYVYQTVPVVIHTWLRHQGDYRTAVKSIIRCGGDADTTAAIVGGIMGAGVGADGIPREWRERIIDWPLTINWIERLAAVAARGALAERLSVPNLSFSTRLLRNFVLLSIVLAHGFRRLAPPY